LAIEFSPHLVAGREATHGIASDDDPFVAVDRQLDRLLCRCVYRDAAHSPPAARASQRKRILEENAPPFNDVRYLFSVWGYA
jgi:hypothetical protein